MRKLIIGSVIFFTGFISALILTHGSLRAEDAGNAEIIAKLNDVAKGQQYIIATINSMREDLQIVKVRVTQMQ